MPSFECAIPLWRRPYSVCCTSPVLAKMIRLRKLSPCSAIFGSFFLEFSPAAVMFIVGSAWVCLSHYGCGLVRPVTDSGETLLLVVRRRTHRRYHLGTVPQEGAIVRKAQASPSSDPVSLPVPPGISTTDCPCQGQPKSLIIRAERTHKNRVSIQSS